MGIHVYILKDLMSPTHTLGLLRLAKKNISILKSKKVSDSQWKRLSILAKSQMVYLSLKDVMSRTHTLGSLRLSSVSISPVRAALPAPQLIGLQGFITSDLISNKFLLF